MDRHLVGREAGKLKWLYRFEDVGELEMVHRWPRRLRRWMIIIGSLAVVEGFAFLFILTGRPSAYAGISTVGFLLLGAILMTLAMGLDPQRWVLIHTNRRTHRIPLSAFSEKEAQEAVGRLRREIDEGLARPAALLSGEQADPADVEGPEAPSPVQVTPLDPVKEGIREGRCHRCGYDLRGPQVLVNGPVKSAQQLGVVLIILGCLFSFCCGLATIEPVFCPGVSIYEAMPCLTVIAIAAAAIGLGVWLVRMRRDAPAVPDWEGIGHCSACGWRHPDPASLMPGADPPSAPPTTPAGQDT